MGNSGVAILLFVIELFKIVTWADVRVSCVVDVSVDPDEGDVVEEVARVVLVVDEDVDDVELDVRVKLRVVVHVPFANTNSVQQKNPQSFRSF